MHKKLFWFLLIVLIFIGASIIGGIALFNNEYGKENFFLTEIKKLAVFDAVTTVLQAGPRNVSFFEEFNKNQTIEENWPMKRSGSKIWWVSSGAYLFVDNGVGKTITGDLSESDPWVEKFKSANAEDTSNGLRPQNIFRLVFKKTATNVTQSLYTKMTHYDVSDSPNRNASNGILLFNRYLDEYSLYYLGIRVDGQAVVKKKLNGTYSTLGVAKIFTGEYDITNNPNLIPMNTWIGLKSVVKTDSKGIVHLDLYTDIGRTGDWKLVLSTIDDGKTFGSTISKPGYGGIRTDFLDAEFDDYEFKAN